MSKPKHEARPAADLQGRVALVTGANSGLGFETAAGLFGRGAHVVMACRDLERAGAAAQRLRERSPHGGHGKARVTVLSLDLADLDSVQRCAENFCDDFSRLDMLCNNAGVMGVPQRTTRQGFEFHFGVNHLGHFALTGRLLPRLLTTPGARVVTVSSLAHKRGQLDLDELESPRSYDRWSAYAASKLANLSFALELDRRARAAKVDLASLGAHPGYAATSLLAASPDRHAGWFMGKLVGVGDRLFAQSAAGGAGPSLKALTQHKWPSGAYLGPSGRLELRGEPGRAKASPAAMDPGLGARLWAASVQRVGSVFDGL